MKVTGRRGRWGGWSGVCRLPVEDCENANTETDAEAVQLDRRLGKNRFPVPSRARPRRTRPSQIAFSHGKTRQENIVTPMPS